MIIATRRGSGGTQPSGETNQLRVSWYGSGYLYVGNNDKVAEPVGKVQLSGREYDVYDIPRGSLIYAVDSYGGALGVEGFTDYASINTSFFGYLDNPGGGIATLTFIY